MRFFGREFGSWELIVLDREKLKGNLIEPRYLNEKSGGNEEGRGAVVVWEEEVKDVDEFEG